MFDRWGPCAAQNQSEEVNEYTLHEGKNHVMQVCIIGAGTY